MAAGVGVAELRWVSGGLVSVLRTSVEVTVREFAATADPASGLAAVHLLQALVLAVLDEGGSAEHSHMRKTP